VRRTWVTSRRDVRDGKACRVITVVDDTGAPRLVAVAFPWRRAIDVSDAAGRPAWHIVRRRTFPLTGTFDVVLPGGERLGTLNRNGRVRDRHGVPLGRFRDERSIRGRAGASVIEGLANLVAGLDDASVPAGPSGYVWMVEGAVRGTLRRARRPSEDPAFCFERVNAWAADPRLELAAVVAAVELTYW
jgi:hypothetical protein